MRRREREGHEVRAHYGAHGGDAENGAVREKRDKAPPDK
jgi:hypothetical protein